jgi:hypothetical protein
MTADALMHVAHLALAATATGLAGCDEQVTTTGLRCDLVTTLTSDDPGGPVPHNVKTQDTKLVIKFVGDYWRVVSENDVPRAAEAPMNPLRITDAAYVLSKPNEETSPKGIHTVSAGALVDRNSGDYSATMDTDMPKVPGVHIHADLRGHCDPVGFAKGA